MAKINGFKSEAPSNSFPMLPVGAYVCGIKNVKIEGKAPDQQIVLRLDIIEGEQTAYYTKRYNHDTNAGGKYEVRYKGDFKIQIPDANNAKRQHPEWDLKTLNNSIWCIEASNPGFKWDGDTDHIGELKGKLVGINVREGVYNGNTFTQIGKLETVDDVRQGLVKPMKPRSDGSSLPQTAPAAADPSGFTPVETEELPF
jgi:hypothetical protein